MREELCKALLTRSENPNMIFLTGDLGFMALEELEKKMGPRFINAGISEQNMMSVAAAMAYEKLEPWVYSIAPFCYARPFEQIRNDVAFHNVPVKIIGNGGGYGYGVMGPSHHAIEDYGILLTLPHLRVIVPAFNEDVCPAINAAGDLDCPVYLRLGRGENEDYNPPPYSPWRKITDGNGRVVISIGPIAGSIIKPLLLLPFNIRPQLWIVSELPIEYNLPPRELMDSIISIRKVTVIEEHVSHGGLGSIFAKFLLKKNVNIDEYDHCYAIAHHFSTYGSQTFMRKQSGLDVDTLLGKII